MEGYMYTVLADGSIGIVQKGTALHNAESKEIAQRLVESVEPDKRREFVLSVDGNQCTALHLAVNDEVTDVIAYLCSLPLLSNEMIPKKNGWGRTALYYAKNQKVAQLLVESVESDKRQDFILSVDLNHHYTVLHIAVMQGRTDVVEYLCSIPIIGSQLILTKDRMGKTALSYAESEEIVQLLVQSVEPEKLSDFISNNVDENRATALHVAASEGRTDVVKCVCRILSLNNGDLILAKNKWGRTALHGAKSKEIAELLVDSVEPGKQKDFILTVDEDQRSALHMAAGLGRTDVVEFLCSLPLHDAPGSKLILGKDKTGKTALHYAKSEDVARLLLEFVEYEKRRDFVSTGDENHSTALHTAVTQDRPDVAKCLCNLFLPDNELTVLKNKYGRTALHYAKSKEIAQLLVESVESDKLTEFLLSTDVDGHTALHTSVHLATKQGKIGVVTYLCNIPLPQSELILSKSKLSQTALHYAESKEIAQILVESVEQCRQRDLVLAVKEDLSTALHVASKEGRTGVVEYLCSLPLPDSELILQKDKWGKTALHHAKNKDVAQILVQSVEPEKQRNFLLAVDKDLGTALLKAVDEGRADVVKYLCGISLPGSELILERDRLGGTPLHYAKSKEMAQVLVESVESAKQRDFVLTVNENQWTALHSAVVLGIANLTKYLCSIALPDSELILQKDKWGNTALYYAKSKEMAQLLVESVEPDKLRKLMISGDEHQCTVLHIAARDRKTLLVKYFCSVPLPASELILQKDKLGRTALHHAKSREIAQTLVESVEPEKRKDFLFEVDEDQCTALHTAVELGSTSLVEYLCSIPLPDRELALQKDKHGRTALHTAARQVKSDDSGDVTSWPFPGTDLVFSKDKWGNQTVCDTKTERIALLLVESVDTDKQIDFILTADEKMFTALHIAAQVGQVDVVEYLCSHPLLDDELIFQKDAFGNTALHHACSGKVVNLILSSIDPEQAFKLLDTRNKCRNTVHLSLTMYGRADALASVFEYIRDMDEEDEFIATLVTYRNDCEQNILHLAALSLATADLYEVLQECLPDMNMNVMLSPDKFKNTPLHYVAAKYDARVFADFILRLPLTKREDIAKSSNVHENDCNTIARRQPFSESFYLRHVLCETNQDSYSTRFAEHEYFPWPNLTNQLQHPEEYYKPNEKILQVLKYALNEYSLLGSANTLFSSAAFGLPQNTEKKCEDGSESRPDSLCIYIDYDEIAEPRQENIQKILNKMDRVELHGRPKIAVVQCMESTAGLNLILPNPDYLILTVKYHTLEYGSKQKPDLNEYESTDDLINKFRCDADVVRVCIVSSLNRKYLRDDMGVKAADTTLSSTDTVLGSTDTALGSTDTVPGSTDTVLGSTDTVLGSTDTALGSTDTVPSSTDTVLGSTYTVLGSTDTVLGSTDTVLGSTDTVLSSSDTVLGSTDTALSCADTALSAVKTGSTTPPPLILTGNKRGKALIICNQYEVKPGMSPKELQIVKSRKITLPRAKTVLESLFGLEVQVETDLTADEMKKLISKFSQSEGHGSLVALVILSHGYKRMISGTDGSNSECSVQEVVDSLHDANISNIPKLLFLSFCRGKLLPQYNRAPHNFESSPEFPWPENEIGMTLQPIRQQLLPENREQEWTREKFPNLDVPVDFYICFSTLPESLSKTGLFFQNLVEHLSEISRKIPDADEESDTPLDCTSEQVDITASTATTCQPVSRVELVTLLTDVAGIVKEKSRSTQYVNTCYTLDRNSPQVFIDILPV